MDGRHRVGSASVVFLALGIAGCGSNSGGTGYKATVAPIFQAKCVNCHWTESPIGYQLQNPFDPTTGIVGRLGSWTAARHATVVVPGSPDQSFLVDKVQATDLNPDTEGASMPFSPAPVTTTELASIRTWIQNGANNDAFYQANVAPIFGNGKSLGAGAGKCSYCHTAQSINLPDLTNPFDTTNGVVGVTALVGGTRVIPGDPDHSVLFQKVSAGVSGTSLPSNLRNPMPYQTPKLTTSEIAALVTWIAGGAKND
jgi:hypothetical protein